MHFLKILVILIINDENSWDHFLQDYLMFKWVSLMWNINLLQHYTCFYCYF